MLVARHWAYARVHDKRGGRQVTIRRWGWSDESLSDAQAKAEARCHEALEQVFAGRELSRRELVGTYHGDEGRPIREELLERVDEDTAITRNSYGAACLNVREVVFADMDMPPVRRVWVSGLVSLFTRLLRPKSAARRDTDARAELDARIDAAMARRPDWLVDVYRTPNGLRLLLRSHRFDPGAPEVTRWFEELQVDGAYAHLCRLQRCYRARLTAKPWRVGVSVNLPKRAMRWPTPPECAAQRHDWVDRYQRHAISYAACHYERTVGHGRPDPRCESVKRLHDDRSRALASSLPLA